MPNSGQAELADVGRLARRLVNRAVEAARTQDQPLRRLLLGHLGPDAGYLPTVSATWPGYEHVNVQVGLDAWLADDAGGGAGGAGGGGAGRCSARSGGWPASGASSAGR